MASHHLFLFWTLTAVAFHAGPATAGRRRAMLVSPAQPKPNATGQFLAAHNKPRAAVGVAALSWSPKLAASASLVGRHQRDEKGCGFADESASPYGANQGWASYPAGPAEVVGSWVAEGKYYSHVNNTCAVGHECGTYTQVVWRKTKEVGCGQVRCKQGATLTICFYNPPGNIQGQSPY